MRKEYDIIIGGAGISGALAAAAAGRLGARCLVLEQYGFPGGMLTAGGVGPMMTFHAGTIQTVQGLCGELVQRMRKKGWSPGHIPDSTGYTYTVTPFDAEGLKKTLEEMVLESGGEFLYHTMLAGAETENGRVTRLIVANKAGISFFSAPIYIDATGDGDLCHWAKVPMDCGRPEDGKNMPLTMNLKMGGVDTGKIRAYMREHPDQFTHISEENIKLIDRAVRLSVSGFHREFRRACAEGRVSSTRGDLLFFETNTPGQVIINTANVAVDDPTDPWELSRAEITGRQRALQLAEFLTGEIPGFEHAQVLQTGPAIGVRSSRRIQGKYQLTVEDMLSEKYFSDAVAYGGYPVDVPPSVEKDGRLAAQRKIPRFTNGECYGVPYRCLLNSAVKNLITVGRCISATYEAQGAIRVTPIAGAVGHAGGVAAALAVKGKILPEQVPVRMIQNNLKQQGAFLLEKNTEV